MVAQDTSLLQPVHQGDESTSTESQTRPSSYGGSPELAALFYPPLHASDAPPGKQQHQQQMLRTASADVASFSGQLQAKPMQQDDGMHVKSSPASIKAHRGSFLSRSPSQRAPEMQGEGVDAMEQPGKGEQRESGNSAWDSPVRRRRPLGDSGSSLASTPPPRGLLRFPSRREGRSLFRPAA